MLNRYDILLGREPPAPVIYQAIQEYVPRYENILAGKGIFTGSPICTLDVLAIQTLIETDHNCIAYVEQSSDCVSWDIIDQFTPTYNVIQGTGSSSYTVQVVNSYAKVRVKNVGDSTMSFKLQVILCPVPRSRGNIFSLPFQYGAREMRNRYRSLYHVDESVARTIDLLAERVVQNESV